MKKVLLIIVLGASVNFSFAQTATNFNVNDCSGNNHDLFTELDAGKVVVITWPMPCGACIAPASTAANAVVSYSNPDIVFYLVDDYGNTTCSSLNSWAATNSITTNATFSNAAISMTNYGTAGMPKTVVLGGATHSVFYNVNGTVVLSDIQTAIDNALAAANGVSENQESPFELNVYPNPADHFITLDFTLNKMSDVKIEITNVLGETVKSDSYSAKQSGTHKINMDLDAYSSGVYFVKMTDGISTQTRRMVISR